MCPLRGLVPAALAVLLAAGAVRPLVAQPHPAALARADTAYLQGRYEAAAMDYERAFAASIPRDDAVTWRAARSLAQAGAPTRAVHYLALLLHRDPLALYDQFPQDALLTPLRATPEGLAFQRRLRDAVQQRYPRLIPDLRAALLEMEARSRRLRARLDSVSARRGARSRQAIALLDSIAVLDRRQVARLRTLIDTYGWPAYSMVGEEGARAAFLLLQHAAPAYQLQVMPLIEEAARRREANGALFAIAQDRALRAAGVPQRFGTQLVFDARSRRPRLYPIEAESEVDARRAAIGLQPLAEYLARWGLDYQPAE